MLAAIALIFVLARIGTRLYVFRRIHMDDGFAILALVVLIANGVGLDLEDDVVSCCYFPCFAPMLITSTGCHDCDGAVNV